MKLYVARHGQTIANRDHIISGYFDTPLSQQGIEQAINLGEALKDFSFDVIYTSDLVRAMKTWMLVYDYHSSADFTSTPLLRERWYGIWEWVNVTLAIDKIGVPKEKFWSKCMENGEWYESDDEYVQRVTEFFKEEIFPHSSTNKKVFIACHKGTCNIIAGLLRWDAYQYLLEKEHRIDFKNTAYSMYDITSEGVIVVQENICDHLDC